MYTVPHSSSIFQRHQQVVKWTLKFYDNYGKDQTYPHILGQYDKQTDVRQYFPSSFFPSKTGVQRHLWENIAVEERLNALYNRTSGNFNPCHVQ